MSVHNPESMPTNSAEVANAVNNPGAVAPSSATDSPETSTHNPADSITTLLRLAGKSDLKTIDDLRAALMGDINLVRQAIYILTSTSDQPVFLSFDQLIPQTAIDAYRDEEGNPLPGAIPKGDGLPAHLIEIPYSDPACTPGTRRNFLRHLLIPQTHDRIREMLKHIAPLSLYTQVPHDHSALFSELSHRLADAKLSHCICQTAPEYNGSPCFAGEMPEGAIKQPYVTD